MTGAKALQTGSIEILGGPISDPKHRRKICPAIAFMPQGLGRNLYAELSVRENLEFFSRLFGKVMPSASFGSLRCYLRRDWPLSRIAQWASFPEG